MSDHDSHLLGLHGLVGLMAGLTGAAIADRLVTVLMGILSSLTILVVTELLRPWLRRRTARPPSDDGAG